MAALEVDMAAAANRHNEIIDRPNSLHLFSDNWPVRRWTNAWVAEQKTVQQPDQLFEELETATLDGISDALADQNSAPRDPAGQVLPLGSVSQADLVSLDEISPLVRKLAAAYAHLDERFAVPYFEIQT